MGGDYSTWGKVSWQHPQASPLMQKRIKQNLRYAGQYADEGTGLHYNTFRFYDPDIGRFISQDPIGLAGGLNLYQYAPNPGGWIDPLGLNTLPTLPPSQIANGGGVTIEHYYHGNDHLPAHAHVVGEGQVVKIGANGKPLKGEPALSGKQQKLVIASKSKIRSSLNKVNRFFKAQKYPTKSVGKC